MNELRGRAAVVGAALADIGKPGLPMVSSAHELAAQASLRALQDAGLDRADVDGLFCCGFGPDSSLEFGEYLGLRDLAHFDTTNVGGSSWVTYVEHAAGAIHAGLCTTALLAHAELGYTDRARGVEYWQDPRTPLRQFDLVYGNSYITAYALIAQRYLWQYGLSPDALAHIAVSTRQWASLNPLARFRDLITVEDVLASPMISSPFHLLDCCLVSDGGGAVVLQAADRARGTRKPISVLGVGSCQTHLSLAEMPDLLRTGAVVSGRRAFEMAGMGPDDIDLLMLYDSFTITPTLALEDLGFCGPGEATQLAAEGVLAPGGRLPMNTNGGGLSFCHSGMYGMFTLVEAVTQLRGEAEDRQAEGVEVAVAHGVGEFYSATGTAVLAATR